MYVGILISSHVVLRAVRSFEARIGITKASEVVWQIHQNFCADYLTTKIQCRNSYFRSNNNS